MEKSYYKVLYALFGVVLVVGLALRLYLKLAYTDPATGFLMGAPMVHLVYQIVLGVGLVALPVLNIFHKGRNDYQVLISTPLLPALSILTGLALGLYVAIGLPNPLGLVNPATNPTFITAVRYANIALGGLSALALVVSGVCGFLGRTPPALLTIMPAVFQITLVLSRFNGYHSVFYIAEYLLAILFMLFAALFFMGHARTLCGYGRKDGHNYILSSGFCAAICGFLLVIPHFLDWVIYPTATNLPLLSVPECLYVLLLSLYCFLFAHNYIRSMKSV
jgi:hypothetical protein